MTDTTATTSSAIQAPPSISLSDTLANQAGTSFCLFNSDWLSLQNFVAKALALPITTPDFTATYGTFTDMQQVTDCVNSLSSIAGLAKTMGNPTELQAKIAGDPTYVSGNSMPTELYAQCIWLAGQLQQTAQSFSSNYSNLNFLFSGTQAEITANIVDFLTGDGGLVSMAQAALTQTETVQNNLSAFQAQMQPLANEITTYFSNSVNVLTDAQNDYNTDVSDITNLHTQAAAAHKAWEDYTIAATTASVGLMVISAGLLLPVAAGLGIGLGIEASKEMDDYNNLMTQIAAKSTDEQQKNRLILDLSSFNNVMTNIDLYVTSFMAELAKVQGVWTNQITSLTTAADYCQNHDFSTYSEMASKMNILSIQNSWQQIAYLTSKFTTGCLVNYLNTIKFPQQIPAGAATAPSAN